jgi:hypothetical protein
MENHPEEDPMRARFVGLVAVVAAMLPTVAEACHGCGKAPCVVRPAYTTVTEMVPYTVYKTRMRTEFVPKTCTVMERIPQTHYVNKTITTRRPVYETSYVQRVRTVRRPIHETSYVTKYDTVCQPVTTTRQVTSYCLQPTGSWTEAVPAKCGSCLAGLLCHKHGQKVNYVTKTSYAQVPVTRDVVETSYVRHTTARQVPVHHTRFVCEQVVETVPVKHCRFVVECKTIQVPVTTYTCVPRQVTKMVPIRVPEHVAVTCYKPVKHVVPCAPAPVYAPAPVAYAAPQAASPQAASPQAN